MFCRSSQMVRKDKGTEIDILQRKRTSYCEKTRQDNERGELIQRFVYVSEMDKWKAISLYRKKTD